MMTYEEESWDLLLRTDPSFLVDKDLDEWSPQDIITAYIDVIVKDGVEIYTSQDGCYAEYEYNKITFGLFYDADTDTSYFKEVK